MMFYFKRHKPQHPPQCFGNAVTVYLFIEWKKEDKAILGHYRRKKKFLLALELRRKLNYGFKFSF